MSALTNTLAGSAPPATIPWTSVPTLKFIWQQYGDAAVGGVGTALEVGSVLMWYGQLSEAYTVLDGLDASVRSIPDATTRKRLLRPAAQIIARMGDLRQYAEGALQELLVLGVPEPHVRLLSPYLHSDNPVTRLSGVATAVVMACVFLNGLPYELTA